MDDVEFFLMKAILYVMNRLACLLVLIVVAVLTGCSNHPPSAAQFMNVNKNGGSLVLGGSAFVGDVHRGTYRFESDYFDAEDYGALDISLLMRFDHFIIGASLENISICGIAGFRSQYVGLQGWGLFATNTVDRDAVPFSGGLMLIEEYSVNDDFRVGLSEHISRNAYNVDENLGGIGFYSTGFYDEFGVGTYLTYKGFSLEFRYGREIDEPRNRFYFMINYAFMSGKSS